MASPVDPTIVVQILGPELIGLNISWLLYGALVLQLFNYIYHWHKDRRIVVSTVFVVFFAETLLILVTTRVSFALLCEGWGDPAALTRLEWVDAFIPIISGFISGWVQFFYAWRIYVLGKGADRRLWRAVTVLILPFAIASSVSAFYAGFSTINDKQLANINSARTSIVVWLVCSVVCDLMIAASMLCVINTSRKQIRTTGNVYTEERLAQVVRLSIETGALTMTSAIVMLVFFFALPKSRLFTVMGFINSKLYSNSIMTSLNSRDNNRSQNDSQTYSNAGVSSGLSVDKRVSVAVFPTPVPPRIRNVHHEAGLEPLEEDEEIPMENLKSVILHDH